MKKQSSVVAGIVGFIFAFCFCAAQAEPVAYVSADGSNEAPYDTWETAAHSIQDAIDAIPSETPGTVKIAEGTYLIPGWYLVVDKPVLVEGIGARENVILKADCMKSGGGDVQRVMDINHPDAVVRNLTMRDGYWEPSNRGPAGVSWGAKDGAGGFELSAGTVTNCVIRDNKGRKAHGAGGWVKGGLVTDCLFEANYCDTNSGGEGLGGGVRIDGGVVENCVFRKNKASRNGGSVSIGSGVLRDSLLEESVLTRVASRDDWWEGAGVHIEGGLVERCVIKNCSSAVQGGGVAIKAGEIRNCLVIGNTSNDGGGGIYVKGTGVVRFCTVAGNTSSTKAGSGIYQTGGTVVDTISWANGLGLSDESVCNIRYEGGALTNNVLLPAPDGNFDDDPLFSDVANGDYHIEAGSSAIDKAVGAVEVDLDGVARPKDGNGTGTAVADIGCYEAAGPNDGALRCIFSASATEGLDSLEVDFTASVAGEGTVDGAVGYAWDFGGGRALTAADGPTVTVAFDSYGEYTISLTVSLGEATATRTFEKMIRVGSRVAHIAEGGTGVWPYATEETATNDVTEVFSSMVLKDEVENLVLVHPGTFRLNSAFITLASTIRVRGVEGPSVTTLVANNPGDQNRKYVFDVLSPDVSVEGLTITGGQWEFHQAALGDRPGGIRLTDGLVTNCVITGCCGSDKGGGVQMSGGRVVDCVIQGNEACRGRFGNGSNPGAGHGGGVYLFGGELVDCVITNNTARQGGAGIEVDQDGASARVRNCLIGWNRGKENVISGGLELVAGLVENCVIRDNTMPREDSVDQHNTQYLRSGGVRISGAGELRNCLVMGNTGDCVAQGVRMTVSGARMVNCTVAANGDAAASEGKVAASLDAGTVVNTVIYGNKVTDVAVGEAVMSNCCWPGAEGASNISDDPQFNGADDFRLASGSPCRNKGDNAVWTDLATAVDLDGLPRLVSRAVDIGCYEDQRIPGCVIIVR